MINLFNFNTLSILAQIKLCSIISMILILFFLILIEIKNKFYPNKQKYQESGFFLNKNLTRFMGIVGGASSLGSFIINKNKKDLAELSNNIGKQSEDLKKQIMDLEDSQSTIKTTVIANIDSMKEIIIEMKKQVEKTKEIINKNNDKEVITQEDINSNSDLQFYLSQIESNWEKIVNYSEEIKAEFDKNNKFLPDNFNISNLYENLTNDQLGGIGLILFSQVILASTISILFIFFGEYLIQQYDLENKYPKLVKFIKLRRKFQRYYLILNIFYISSIGILLGLFGL